MLQEIRREETTTNDPTETLLIILFGTVDSVIQQKNAMKTPT